MAVPALLSAAFHVAWIVILLAWAAATDGWPRHCASSSGEQYAVLFVAFLAACATNLAIDLLLAWHSLRGAPFEASKRAWVALLLYASTAPLVVQLGLAAWGAYVSTQLQPECWPPNQRNAGAGAPGEGACLGGTGGEADGGGSQGCQQPDS